LIQPHFLALSWLCYTLSISSLWYHSFPNPPFHNHSLWHQNIWPCNLFFHLAHTFFEIWYQHTQVVDEGKILATCFICVSSLSITFLDFKRSTQVSRAQVFFFSSEVINQNQHNMSIKLRWPQLFQTMTFYSDKFYKWSSLRKQ